VVAADAAGSDDHRLRAQREIADDLARTALATFAFVGSRIRPRPPSTVPLVIASASTMAKLER
jgi:hypothetical protein